MTFAPDKRQIAPGGSRLIVRGGTGTDRSLKPTRKYIIYSGVGIIVPAPRTGGDDLAVDGSDERSVSSVTCERRHTRQARE